MKHQFTEFCIATLLYYVTWFFIPSRRNARVASWVLRKTAPMMKNIPARVILAAVFGMLELYGYVQTGKDAVEVGKELWKGWRNRGN